MCCCECVVDLMVVVCMIEVIGLYVEVDEVEVGLLDLLCIVGGKGLDFYLDVYMWLVVESGWLVSVVGGMGGW